MNKRHQVVIVGGGPVGVALAVELGRRGITCALVERRLEPQRIPKGQNLSQRTLEHFYFWGLVDELRTARIMPPGYLSNSITAYKDLMSEHWYAPPQREVVQSFYFQANERLPQYLLEEVLRRRMADMPEIETRFGWSAETIEQDADGARVAIAEEGGAGREVLEADYVVGCDGGRSMVRDQVGIDCVGEDYDQMMVLAVFRSRALHEAFKRFPERSTYRAMHPDLKGYWQFFGRIDVGEGWFFHAPVPPDTTKDNYDFRALLYKAAGFEFECELDHVGFWDLRVLVADRYRVGRVFIAGDAAHSHPPYGGFGLNNGLEDIVNLGWKLAARLQGWGGDSLLRSYGEERRPVFEETGRDFIAGRIAEDRKFLETYDPERDLAAFQKAWEAQAAGIGAQVMTYEPNYEGSPVVLGPPGGVCSAHGHHSFEAKAGHHLPPQALSSGRNVFEELGEGFTLLAFGAEDAAIGKIEAAATASNVPLKIVRDSYEGGRAEYGTRLILVRPDQYVVWAGDGAPADAKALMMRVVGKA